MKNFKRFAIALVAVVLVLIIGLFFKDHWGPIVWAWIEWICGKFGVDAPEGFRKIFEDDAPGYTNVD